jgi:general secretion pathway protein A
MIYENYFSMQQRPFSIAPNPDFLFAHGQYQEAIAVLEYGMVHRGGFTLLTGEVGTGKTTLCKHLLHLVPESTEVALILHPQLDRIELLQLICREFDLDVRWEAKEIELIETLTEFLLSVYAKGGYSLLVIDEAQHLDTSVLELIRLLTNLETHTDKLLQIILLGQPELKNRLEQYSLRQLNQRFTARFHLKPLSFSEVRQYLQHRLAVAGASRGLFSYAASYAVYRLSGGIPRLINLLADRSLMGSYAQHFKKVHMHVVNKAAKEVLPQKKSSNKKGWLGLAAISLVLTAFFIAPSINKSLFSEFNGIQSIARTVTDTSNEYFNGNRPECSALTHCWQGRLPQDLVGFSENSVRVFEEKAWRDWSGPIDNQSLVLAQISWKAPFLISASIKQGDSHEAVSWVREILKASHANDAQTEYSNWQVIKPQQVQGGLSISDNYYDALLVESVKTFQKKHHLLVDGILGKQTLISLALWNNKMLGQN